MKRILTTSLLLAATIFAQQFEIAKIPDNGLVILPISQAQAQLRCEGIDLQSQNIPPNSLAIQFPQQLTEKSQRQPLLVTIMPKQPGAETSPKNVAKAFIKGNDFTVDFDQATLGAFPSKITFKSGRVLDNMTWGDRVYSNDPNHLKERGEWRLHNDPSPLLQELDGPIAKSIIVHAKYHNDKGIAAPHGPRATYAFTSFKREPQLIYVTASFSQDEHFDWKERHFMSFHLNDGGLGTWQGGDVPNECRLSGPTAEDSKGHKYFKSWAAFEEDGDFVAIRTGNPMAMVHLPLKIKYIHASGRSSWTFWSKQAKTQSTWLQIGSSNQKIESEIEKAAIPEQPGFFRNVTAMPDLKDVEIRESNDLQVGFKINSTPEGQTAALTHVLHKQANINLMHNPQNLFSLIIQQISTRERIALDSSTTWKTIRWQDNELVFTGPTTNDNLENLQLRLNIDANKQAKGIQFKARITTGNKDYRPMELEFASLSLQDLGLATECVVPESMGTRIVNPATSSRKITGNYSSFMCTMPWFAFWDKTKEIGFYLASHDPTGAAKTVTMDATLEPFETKLAIAYILPSSSDNPDQWTETDGTVIWKTFDGDWYDAALIYRDFVRKQASWFPKMGPQGRVNAPMWFKRTGVFQKVAETGDKVVPQVKEFRSLLPGIETGVHWYRWHQIPWDNDYPHYIPAKPGFEEAVKAIQAEGAHVIPYTNGRLWDTRDRGIEDYQYSMHGKLGACKKTDGTPYTEHYKSKESDGSRVKFSPMCPGSKIWKDKVAENVKHITTIYGLDGCYMDQIGACSPVPCEDTTHGHPTRGGNWWTAEYRKLLENIRNQIPDDKIFATEGNSETVIDQMNMMICWQIEGDDNRIVPAFATVYSGAAFLYGSSIPNNPRAMRMKWANNLINGDILGWFPVTFIREKNQLDYVKKLLNYRQNTVEFFYDGEMTRSPKISGTIPTWNENWDLFGKVAYNEKAVVQAGARRIVKYQYDKDGNRLWDTGKIDSALITFTNFADEPVEATVEVSWKDLGINPKNATLQRVNHDGSKTPVALELLNNKITFQPRDTWGIIVTPNP